MPRCPRRTCRLSPVSGSHSRAVLSWLPVATISPSGLIATAATASVCPRRACTALPVETSQTLAVWSALPVTRRDPSADRATPPTQPSCPLSVCTSCAAAGPAVVTRRANETNLDTGGPVGGWESTKVDYPRPGGGNQARANCEKYVSFTNTHTPGRGSHFSRPPEGRFFAVPPRLTLAPCDRF